MLGSPAKRLSWPFRQPDQGGGARQGTGKKTTGKKTPLCSLRVQVWEEGAREMAASRSSRLLTLALSQGLWALMSPSLTSCSPLESSRGKEPGARGWGRGGQLWEGRDGVGFTNRNRPCNPSVSPSAPPHPPAAFWNPRHTQESTCKQQLLHPRQHSFPDKICLG